MFLLQPLNRAPPDMPAAAPVKQKNKKRSKKGKKEKKSNREMKKRKRQQGEKVAAELDKHSQNPVSHAAQHADSCEAGFANEGVSCLK